MSKCNKCNNNLVNYYSEVGGKKYYVGNPVGTVNGEWLCSKCLRVYEMKKYNWTAWQWTKANIK